MFVQSRQHGRAAAWVGFWTVLLSYLALLVWRAIQWDQMSEYPVINGFTINTLLAYLFFEANEPTLVIATLASLSMRMGFDGDIAALLETFAGRHPTRASEYQKYLDRFEREAGRRSWIITAVVSTGVAVFAWIFHRTNPDSGLYDWRSITVRAICVVFLVWVACWSVSGLRNVIRPLMGDISNEIQPLHPDHSGGVGEFGACIVRLSSPLIAVVLLLASWAALPIISEDYDASFGAFVVPVLVLCAVPLVLYAWLPLWHVHVLLDRAKARMLDSLWLTKPIPSVAEEEQDTMLKTIEYVNGVSAWPFGSLSPVILLIVSQGAALLPKILGK